VWDFPTEFDKYLYRRLKTSGVSFGKKLNMYVVFLKFFSFSARKSQNFYSVIFCVF
jgi:hypothetical protein